jgi:HTH-type transcriptional regulator / antitoxin HigA
MAMTAFASHDAASGYFELVHRLPLRPIQTDDGLHAAIAMIDELLDRSELLPDEADYLEVLGRLVEDYENQHVHIPEVRGVRALQHLMEENGLKQSDLAHLFGGKSAISEVLRGNRALSKSQIVRLRDYFGVPADTFIG